MKKENELAYCKNCQKELSGKYCAHCGTPKVVKRINGQYIIDEIGAVLNFDKGILYTIKELSFRPGATIREFILEDRNRLVKPVIFIIISSLIYSFLQQILRFEDGYLNYGDLHDSTIALMFNWVQKNYGYGNLLMGIFIALWTKVLFRKYDYNFYEILILLCFVMGVGMLILAFFGVIEGLTQLKVLDFGGMGFIIYSTWAIGQFFNNKKWTSYLKALFSYILGFLTFTIGILLIGGFIDYIK